MATSSEAPDHPHTNVPRGIAGDNIPAGIKWPNQKRQGKNRWKGHKAPTGGGALVYTPLTPGSGGSIQGRGYDPEWGRGNYKEIPPAYIVTFNPQTLEICCDELGLTYRFAYVPEGTYTMGATGVLGQKFFYGEEKPLHDVSVDEFWMGTTEVPQWLFATVMNWNPSSFDDDWMRPVESIEREYIMEFIDRLCELTGYDFCLPTEAQWEWAAREADSNFDMMFSGSNDLDAVAWNANNSGLEPHHVGLLKPNSLGLYDMTGNVREMCRDYYSDYTSASARNPQGPGYGSHVVVRGGAYSCYWNDCRVSIRSRLVADAGNGATGFRLAIE